MARVKLSYIIGNVEDFEAIGVPLVTEDRNMRLSNDGTKAFTHMELLADYEFNSILVDILENSTTGFKRVSDKAMEDLLLTDEWVVKEVVSKVIKGTK
jgi:hypothetical protein